MICELIPNLELKRYHIVGITRYLHRVIFFKQINLCIGVVTTNVTKNHML